MPITNGEGNNLPMNLVQLNKNLLPKFAIWQIK